VTTFDTRCGTRGARQPKGRLMLWVNSFMTSRIRRKGGKSPMSFNILILTTTGRKSGVERTSPLGWFPDGDGNWLIAASVDGSQTPVTARQLHGAEREAAWQSITTAAPRFAQYQVKTDREIPVILLTPRRG
jgi:hypothetical protein